MATDDLLQQAQDLLDAQKPASPTAPSPSPSPPSSVPGEAGGGGLPAGGLDNLQDYGGLRAKAVGGVPQPILDTLGGDFYLPTTEAAKGEYTNQTGIDVTALRAKLGDERFRRRMEAFREKTGIEPEQRVLDDWRNEEHQGAHNDIESWINTRRGMPDTLNLAPVRWIDTDPRGAHTSLSEWAQDAWYQRAVAPFMASAMGAEQNVLDEAAEGGPAAATYNEGDFWGGLDWFGRFSLGTYLATAAVASDVDSPYDFLNPATYVGPDGMVANWGSPEHLKLIQRGEDLISLSDELSLGDVNFPINAVGWVAQQAGLIGPETREAAADFATGFTLSLVDPDILTIVTLGTGKVAKLTKLKDLSLLNKFGDVTGLSRTARSTAKQKALQQVSDTAAAASRKKGDLDPGEAQKVINDGMAHLRREGGKALELVTERYAQAISALRKPASRGTYLAVREAARRRKALQETFGAAEGAFVQAAEAAAKPGLKGAERSAAELSESFASAQLDHMASEMAHADLVAHRAGLARLTQRAPALRKVSPERAREASAALEGAVTELQAAERALAEASTDEAFEAAGEVFQAANSKYQKAAFDASIYVGQESLRHLDDLIGVARKNADQMKADLDALTKLVAKRKLFNVGPAMRAHNRVVRKVGKQAAGSWADKAALTAFAKATRDLSQGYGKMAGKLDEVPEGMQALARNVDEVHDALRHYDAGLFMRGFIRFSDLLTHAINPSARVFGTTSEDVQSAGISALSEISIMQRDISLMARGLDDAGKADVFRRYITTTDQIDGSILNTIGEGSMWTLSKPVLRAMLREPEAAGKALEALTNMWLPSGKEMAPHMADIQRAAKNLLTGGSVRAKEGSPAQAAALTFDDFSEAMLQVTARAAGLPADAVRDGERARAMAFAAQAVGQAAIMQRASTRVTQLAGSVSPRTMQAVENISKGFAGTSGEEFLEAMKVFDALNIPNVQRKLLRNAMEDVQAGVRLLSDGEGYNALIPQTFIQAMDTRLGNIVKTTEAVSGRITNPGLTMASGIAGGLSRLYNTSIITGLIFPRPSHFTNIFIGNFSQIWAETGLRTAVRTQAQALPYLPLDMASQIPGIGKYSDKLRHAMADKLGVPLERVLPSIFNVVTNPHLSRFYDQALAPNAQKVANRFSQDMTYGDLRRWAVEQRVLGGTFASSSGLARAASSTGHGRATIRYWEKFRDTIFKPSEAYANMADTVEMRQRVALFTDLIANRGMSPEQAGQMVRRSLYDWDAPMTEFETRWLSKMFMFWGFMRRAMGQGARNLVAPLTKEATQDTMRDSLIKSSSGYTALANIGETAARGFREEGIGGAARGAVRSAVTGEGSRVAYSSTHVRDMAKGVEAMKEFARSGYDPDEEDAELRKVYPWWAHKAGNRMFVTNEPMDVDEREAWKAYGRNVSHRATALPSFTPLEMTSFWMEAATLAAGMVVGADGGRANQAYELLDMVAVEQGGRVTGPAMEAVLDAFGRDKEVYQSGGKKVNKFSDRAMLHAAEGIPYMPDLIWEDKKNPDQLRTTPGVYAAYRFATPFSYELTNWMEPVLENQLIHKDLTNGIGWMLGQWLGIGKTYVHDPKQQLEYDRKAAKRRADSEVRELKRVGTSDLDILGNVVDEAHSEEASPEAPTASGDLLRQAQDLLRKE